ncbi:hypothetical protein OPV22_021680 [Ensete ventricosum]|uniref:AP2/ERF domain-containing protein n=1 Tax=Ensete ventricosum TaxID=4639 RepID=A0AAV8QN10_ENSVE|nr:hypothetical protein OPV22_021680 [Ensete ventricosum]
MRYLSFFRGVTRHRWTGRYEAHLWDKNCWHESQNKKGKQGAYDVEEAAAHAYDLAASKVHKDCLELYKDLPSDLMPERSFLPTLDQRTAYIGAIVRKSAAVFSEVGNCSLCCVHEWRNG